MKEKYRVISSIHRDEKFLNDIWIHHYQFGFILGMRDQLNITKSSNSGNSLVVQWLGLPKAWVQSLAWELRSHKPGNTAKQTKTNTQAMQSPVLTH